MFFFQTSFKRRNDLDLARSPQAAKRPRLEAEVSADPGEHAAPGPADQQKDPADSEANLGEQVDAVCNDLGPFDLETCDLADQDAALGPHVQVTEGPSNQKVVTCSASLDVAALSRF
jgi:hypothetical protein